MRNSFFNDVIEGLTSEPKSLSSKYFYDKIGDQLFVEIMQLPEYYLTRAEHEIFKEQTAAIVDSFGVETSRPFKLIELGAGDGTKTKEILLFLTEKGYEFEYRPIDISSHALNDLKRTLSTEIPSLSVDCRQGDYFDVLKEMKAEKEQKIVFFLGSNMGNMSDKQAEVFLLRMNESLVKGDKVLLGLDLIKPHDIVFPAYSDSKGITAKFNLNLLSRINKELGANFDLSQFVHHPEYHEETGIASSSLRSLCEQTVEFPDQKIQIHFQKDERIHTEISRKYNQTSLNNLLTNNDLHILTSFNDSRNYFSDFILDKA